MVEHRTDNARGAGSSPAIQAIRMWYSGCAPDSKSGDVGSNPTILASSRIYNVSRLDENYEIAYPVTWIDV